MSDQTSPLLTDLYQLTMAQAYWSRGMNAVASFEFFVRALPPRRSYLVAAGLEQVVDYLRGFRFDADELEWLGRERSLPTAFVDHLAGLRFSGEVAAMPEGTPFFGQEPVLRVSAPIIEAQLVETRIINLLQYQILVASKAARCVQAAPDRLLVDFGLRRAHGAEAGLMAARASYLAGFAGSSTVLATRAFGVPCFGTMAHSFIQAHTSEREAFLDFARTHPDNVVLLIDTYDTEAGAATVVEVAGVLAREGIAVRGVRLDSGDLAQHASAVRAILDTGDCRDVTIFCSGDLDEHRVAGLVAAGAPIDGFGLGTRVVTSADQPYLECAYKLVEYDGQPRSKRSEGKRSLPARKQVSRRYDDRGLMRGDVIGEWAEPLPGNPLLTPIMREGRLIAELPDLEQARRHCGDCLAALPPPLRGLDAPADYPVELAPALREIVDRDR